MSAVFQIPYVEVRGLLVDGGSLRFDFEEGLFLGQGAAEFVALDLSESEQQTSAVCWEYVAAGSRQAYSSR